MPNHQFEFVVEGPPVSLNAKNHNPKRYQRWIATVRAAARLQWPIEVKASNVDTIEVLIVNYFTESPPDIDNIIKPVLDALCGVAYVDDRQVHRVTSQKVSLLYARVDNPSPLLIGSLEQYSEFLHVAVSW